MSSITLEKNDWKEKYEALTDAIAGALGQKVLNSLVTVAERNRAKGKPFQ